MKAPPPRPRGPQNAIFPPKEAGEPEVRAGAISGLMPVVETRERLSVTTLSGPPDDDDILPPFSTSTPQRQVGRCELFAELAHGGMATVYLGRWLGAGGFSKVVAVKALHRQYARDPEFVRMFLDEGRIVARIQHPNVMPTIDLVEDAGELFIVMDYVPGVTLAHMQRKLVRANEDMPIPVAVRIMSGVLHGLHAAHGVTDETGEPMGLIHRDVSPDNVLVGVDGYARLIDFGIAHALGRSSTTAEGKVKGKPAYFSPEQVLADKLDRQTDVFSASVVLWQCLTGKKLFDGTNLGAISYQIIEREIVAPSHHRAEVSEELDAVVLKGLQRKLADRWKSAEDMAEALEKLGPMASFRDVGAVVRSAGKKRLERAAELVETMEQVPTPDDQGSLELPLYVLRNETATIPAPAPSNPSFSSIPGLDPLPADLKVLSVPASQVPASLVGARRPVVVYAAVAVVAIAGAIALASVGGDETAVSRPAQIQPMSLQPLPPPSPAPAATRKVLEPSSASTAEPARPQPKPRPVLVKPKPRLPDDI